MGQYQEANPGWSLTGHAKKPRGKLDYPNTKFPEKEVNKMGNVLNVYQLVVVDRMTCKILHEKTVIGTPADKGLLDIDFTPEEKEYFKTGRLAVFTQSPGAFERFIPQVELKDVKLT